MVDCNTVLSSAIANLKVAIAESGALVTHDTLHKVTADATQLTQLFQNLIGNAINCTFAHFVRDRGINAWLGKEKTII